MYLFLFDLVLIFIMAKSCSLSFSTCVGIALSSAGTPPCNPEDATIKTSKQNFREREREWEWVGERSSRVREEWTTDTKTTMKMAMKIEKLDIGFPHAILWSRPLGAASQTERERLKKREKKHNMETRNEALWMMFLSARWCWCWCGWRPVDIAFLCKYRNRPCTCKQYFGFIAWQTYTTFRNLKNYHLNREE